MTQLEVVSQLYGGGTVCISSRYRREKCLRTCFFDILFEVETVYKVWVHHEKQSKIFSDEKGRVP
jgi:hypothetical protein